MIAQGDANHGTAIDRRGDDLVRRFEVRIQAAIGVHTGIEQRADVIAAGENAVHEVPAKPAELFLALRIPERVLIVLTDGNVGVHAAAVHADDRLGKEARGHAHPGRHLAADELVELDVVGRSHHFRIAIVDFELRGRDFGVILLVLEAHGTLHFGGLIDEGAQRIARQRVVVTTGVHILERVAVGEFLFGVGAGEQESLNFVGGIQRVAVLLELRARERLQHATNIARVRSAVLIDHFTEHQHLAGAEVIGRTPVERRPIDAQAQIAFLLSSEAADGGAVKRQIIPALQQELLVIIQHVQTAFEVAEHDGHGLDPLLIREVFEALFPDLVDRNALQTLFLGGQIQLFQLSVGEFEKIV